jgi:hypothetical protein
MRNLIEIFFSLSLGVKKIPHSIFFLFLSLFVLAVAVLVGINREFLDAHHLPSISALLMCEKFLLWRHQTPIRLRILSINIGTRVGG